jgi:hypothetical protein
LHNTGSFDITLKSNTTSSAVNRFLLGVDYILHSGATLTIWYDNIAQRWRPVGYTGGFGSTTVAASSSAAFTVGPSGPTTPSFQVDASAVSAITGLKVTAAASANVTLTAIGDTNVNIALTPAGTGLIVANANISLVGGGLKFPATAVPSADVNTLDDYEEGTFTPVLSFGGASVGITYGAQLGVYTKIGRVVHYSIYVTLTSKGSSTGTAAVGGLPFTAANNSVYHAASLYFQNMFFDGEFFMQYALVAPNTSTISLYENTNDGVVNGATLLQNTYFLNSSVFGLSGSYTI